MPPILVPSSAKRIAAQILLIAKLSEREDFILRGFVCDIICPYKELPVSNRSTRTRKILEQCQLHRSNVYIVNCKHISNFLQTIDIEQANVFWVHIEKINSFEDRIRYIMRYVAVIKV